MDLADELKRRVARVEHGLATQVPDADTRPGRLHTAMRYSLEAGGKRLRPVLLLAAAELFGVEDDTALPAAVALECVHTYSLIHDDLPSMDNDDLRRGRPTAHRAFDEATAILAGDALLTHAFALLATGYAAQPALANALVAELAAAAGSRRLIGGQMEDLLAEKKSGVTPAELEFIHLNKTAAMIEASLVMGGWIGWHAHPGGHPGGPPRFDESGAPELPVELAALRALGRHLGLAFQIVDDVLDATSDSATLGKTAGKDAEAGKITYVTLHGEEPARRMAREHTAAAHAALEALPGNKTFLAGLIGFMAARTN